MKGSPQLAGGIKPKQTKTYNYHFIEWSVIYMKTLKLFNKTRYPIEYTLEPGAGYPPISPITIPVNRKVIIYPAENRDYLWFRYHNGKWAPPFPILDSPASLYVWKFVERVGGPFPYLEGAPELAGLRGKAVNVTLPVPSGATWITTDGNQTVYFKYFGLVTRVIIWKPTPHGAKYYDGPPIPSWNSPGYFGLNLEGSGNVVYSTVIPG